MPCYNSEAYVEKAIKSIVGQTYPFWELIIVNDGSYDRTLDIVTGYANQDHRIKVFSKENGGYATAVNFGLDKISGDYFLFLGSDDYLDIHLFERLCNSFEEYGVQPDMVAFRTQIVTKDGELKGVEEYTNFPKPLLTKATFPEFNRSNPEYAAIFSIRDTSRCYKTALLGDTRYFGKTGVDADGIFSMLISHKANTFLNLPVDAYYWYIRENSVSSSAPSLKKHLDRISNWHQFFEIISTQYKNEITSTEQRYLISLSHLMVELSSSPLRAIKYRKLIKKEAKFTIYLCKQLNVSPFRFICNVAKTPFLFSLVYQLYSFLRKGKD